MKLLERATFKRSLDELVAAYGRPGVQLEAWTFDDRRSRLAAEKKLAARGADARIRSAYKPLVCCFLEELDSLDLESVHVEYPTPSSCPSDRFLLEAYPSSALLGGASVSFSPREGEDTRYLLKLKHRDGRLEEMSVFAPNQAKADHVGEGVLTPCGWIRATLPDGSVVDKPFLTDFESIFDAAIKAVADYDWGESEPFFESLEINVGLPAEDLRLPVEDEAISLSEALHEDLYFSLLELFQKKTGRPLCDRTIQPGQIVPLIQVSNTPFLEIELVSLTSSSAARPFRPLDDADFPIGADQVAAELSTLMGRAFSSFSASGRPVLARYRDGSDRGVVISGGQHANETSGVVGALRAAQTLAARPSARFAVLPLENPDGYELHYRLCAGNPRHMYHAARYTALGCDLEYATGARLMEKAARLEAFKLAEAGLHVNLHGYPSHEWARPLTGYIPRGFASWMLPHGFFLVLRYHGGWEKRARRLIEETARSLARDAALSELCARQLPLYKTYSKQDAFEMIEGFPCLVSLDERSPAPLTLITEYPDETISGAAFTAAHEAQMKTVLAAYDAYQALPEREE